MEILCRCRILMQDEKYCAKEMRAHHTHTQTEHSTQIANNERTNSIELAESRLYLFHFGHKMLSI